MIHNVWFPGVSEYIINHRQGDYSFLGLYEIRQPVHFYCIAQWH